MPSLYCLLDRPYLASFEWGHAALAHGHTSGFRPQGHRISPQAEGYPRKNINVYGSKLGLSL